MEISEAAMSSNSSFSQFGVDAMNGYFMASSSSGMYSGDVPPFHPGMPQPDHVGFGLGFCFGDAAVGGATAAADIGAQFTANNLMLSSLASQLFTPAPQPHGDHFGARREEEMNGGYDIVGGDSSGAASLPCPGQSDAHAMAVWSSPKKPYCDWSNADGSRTVSVHGSYHLAGPPEAAGFPYPFAAAGHCTAAPSELSLSLCSKSSSDSMVNTADHCSSEASRSGLTHISRVESKLPQVYYPHARSRPPHFAVVVARSRYAVVVQQVLNDVVGRVLDGVPEAAAYSTSGVDSGTRPSLQASSCSAGAASVVSSNNKLMASPEEHPHRGDAGAPWEEAQRVRSELLKMLQLMDQKYNQCLDEIQSTTAKFNSLMQSGTICAPFAHRAVSAMYHGLRRRITGEIMVAAAAASRPNLGESLVMAAAGERGRSWESAFIQKHWVVQQLRRGEQQCWRPQRGLPEKSVAVLKAWMFENFLRPYPKDCEKDMLAARSGLSRNQVSNWFINARVRLWKPMIEEMYEELKRSSGGGEGLAMEHLTSQDVVG